MTPCLLLLFVSMLFNVGLGSSPDCVTWIEDGICLKGDYRKFQRPSPKTDIEITFLVNEVLNVDDEAQTMTVATVTIYSWLDSRIEIEDSIGNDTEVHVEYQLLQHLWTPDIFFFNLIDFKEMAALDKLSGITIKGSGHVELFSKSIQTVSCSMGFNDFPFDTQTCQLYITSSVHPADEMEFSTELVPNEKLKDDLEKVTVTMEAIPEKDRVVLDALEQEHNFSRAGIVFTLERKASSYIMRYYVPTFGMVFVSFVSFLIPPDAIPGRTGLLVTLFLVLTTIFGNIQV